MRVLRHMLAPLWLPLLLVWAALLYDSPAVRFFSFFVFFLVLRILWRIVVYGIPLGIGLRLARRWL